MNSEENLNVKLSQIDTTGEALSVQIDLSRLIINEHCLGQARRADLAIEKRIAQLNEIRKVWLKTISNYESECVRDTEAAKPQLVECVKRTQQWSKSVREMESKENFLDELIQQADTHLQDMKSLLQQLKGFQFGGQLMTFYEND
jgi:hypothetical protein